MTLEELYAAIGGDYDQAVTRLVNARFVERILLKLPDDPSCADLVRAWGAGEAETAFRAAHTAKGVYANLSLTSLFHIASDITEALRPGNEALRARTDVDALVVQLEQAHAHAVAQIEAFAAQGPEGRGSGA